MVWSVPEPSIDNPDQDSKLTNSKDPPEVLDAEAYDFTLVDSFLDFDSIVDWFQDMPTADMANNNDNEVAEKSVQMVEGDLSREGSFLDQEVLNGTEPNATRSTREVKMETPECEKLGTLSCTVDEGMGNDSEPIANDSTCLFNVEVPESGNVGTLEEVMGNGSEPPAIEPEPPCVVNVKGCENLGFSSCAIEEGMGNISLVGGCESLVVNGGNGLKSDVMNGENVSESSESESASPSSTSSSSDSDDSSGSGSASASDDEDEEEKGRKKGKGQIGNIDVEFEEGEINDSEEKELDTENDDEDEDVDKMVSWSGMIDEDGNDDDEASKGPIRSKNELKNLPTVPPVVVTLELHHQMLPLGVVMSVLGAQVIVEGVEKHDPLNEGSILWMTESRTPLGIVDEIFGPVRNPYYVVRYNSEDEVPKGVQGGTLISFVQEFANHVLNNKDLYKKGYDASGDNDEEVPYEAEFSDDEKEAEYKRMQKTTKRKNHRNRVPQEEAAVPTYPAAPLHDLGSCQPFSGIGQGILGRTIMVPQFPPTAAGINPASSGNWRNGNAFPQPQSSMLPNRFLANGVSGFSENAHSSYQLPVLGIPFQQQSEPSQGLHPATMLPGVQPNIFAQPMYAQGLVGQNQMPFGLSPNHPHTQPPMYTGEQGFFPNGMHSEGGYNLHSSSIPGNPHAPGQFHPGASANRGRKAFHRGGRRGWRPAK